MKIIQNIQPQKKIMGKLDHGVDLLRELTKICEDENIQLGRIEAIGAVQKAHLGYYNQQLQQYIFFNLEQPLEITTLIGNISLKDHTPFVHAHATFADHQGCIYGGHLAAGTIVFACEFIIEVFTGGILEREIDQLTKLPLWK